LASPPLSSPITSPTAIIEPVTEINANQFFENIFAQTSLELPEDPFDDPYLKSLNIFAS
jgi:hypothetical protein